MIEHQSVFLNIDDRINSKTYYYLRIFAHHDFPLIVHDEQYARILQREYWEKLGSVTSPKIVSVTDTKRMMSLKGKLICDNHMVKYHQIHKCFKWYSDDELRDIVLTDMSEGKEWFYEEWDFKKVL